MTGSAFRTAAIGCILALGAILLVGALFVAAPPAAYAAPENFTTEVVVAGLNTPTTFAFAPDGRIFIAEKGGTVRIVKNGVLLPTPFATMPSVNTRGDRGLIGLALDPDFDENGWVYLSYTHENSPDNVSGPKTGRIVRVRAQGAPGQWDDVADMSTYQILVGTVAGSPENPSCSDFVITADCIRSDSISHSVGGLRFGPDGKLYATLGDGASFSIVDPNAYDALDPDALAGKILRINTDGTAPSDNPFYTGNPNDNRSKVWALGLRNSFRFDFRPKNGSLYFGDVGWGSWEEINVGVAGGNYGWPCREGNHPETGYACEVPDRIDPIYEYSHNGGAAAVTGGAFAGNAYPEPYRGSYFFGDFHKNDLYRMEVNDADETVSVEVWDANAGGPVAILQGPDGSIYYVAIFTNELRKITYDNGEPQDPELAAHWTFDEMTAATCADGADVCDATGNGNHGEWSGARGANTTFPSSSDTAPIRQANARSLDFDGTDDHVVAGDLDAFTGDFTISAWIKVRDVTSNRAIMARWKNAGSEEFVLLVNTERNLSFSTQNSATCTGGAFETLLSDSPLSLSEWHHVAAVVDSAVEKRLYIDGEREGVAALDHALPDCAIDTWIGQAEREARAPFHGVIDDVRVYNFALTESEIAELMNGEENQDPIARSDGLHTHMNESLVIDALANDEDPDGDALELVRVTQPANGSASRNADQTITYDPQLDFVGTDNFSYVIADGRGGRATGSISVLVSDHDEGDAELVLNSFSVDPAEPVVGNVVRLVSIVENLGGAQPVIVDLEIYDAAGEQVFQRFAENQVIPNGELREFTFQWQPQRSGEYRIAMGFFTENWASLLQWIHEVQVLTVRDRIPGNEQPVITVVGDNPMTLSVGEEFSDPGATAQDPEEGDLTSEIVVGGDVVDTSATGTYTITYNVTDSDGLAAEEKTRDVIVEEEMPPGGDVAPELVDIAVEDLGESQYRVAAHVKNNGAAGIGLVDIEIYDDSGASVHQQFDNIALAAGEIKSFTTTVTLADGTYWVDVGLFGENWDPFFAWHWHAAKIEAGGTPLPDGDVIYADSLAAGWENWSWDTTLDFANTDRATPSIHIAFESAWAGMFLHHSMLDTSAQNSLAMRLYSEAGGQQLQLIGYNGAGNGTSAALPALDAGWNDVVVPLSDLGLSTEMTGFALMGRTGEIEAPLHADDIELR